MPTTDDVLTWLDSRDRGRHVPVTLTFNDGYSTVETALPPATAALIYDVLRYAGDNGAAVVVPTNRDVSTMEAARLLGMSRSTVVRLIADGQLPSTKAGTHRRLRLVDVLDYRRRARQRAEETATAARLAAVAEETPARWRA